MRQQSWAEPWRIRVVEPLRITSRAERARGLVVLFEGLPLRFFQARVEPTDPVGLFSGEERPERELVMAGAGT